MMSALTTLNNLTQPGQTLAFCDDTDIAGASVPGLAPDLRILCAVIMPSERYAVIAPAMAERLKSLGQAEFHATEIVNPKVVSSWRQVGPAARIEAFRFLSKLLVEPPAKLSYAFIPKGQYEQLKAEAQKLGSVGVNHKAGLKRVFLRCLFERLAPAGGKTVVVLDQDKSDATPVAENWPEGAFLAGGGPISASSALVPGLQVADMAAFCMSRYLRKKQDIAAEEGKPFDLVALETVAGLAGRVECLLKDAPAGMVEKA